MQCQETTAVAEEEECGALMEKKKTLLYFPHELIIQILLRLPVKSLIRFKCVCKSWFSLISDPHFANSHFQLSATTPTRRILLMSSLPPHQPRSIDLEASSLGDDSASVSLNPNFMPFQSYSHIKIRGSCRGFILLHCYSQMMLNIYLCNPSTGFHKKIPLSPFASDSGIPYYHDFYGLGYDQSTDDYLLVSLSYDHLEIFSLRANAWEEIVGTAHLPFGSSDSSTAHPLVFNGAIHWIALCRGIYVIDAVIIAFHLTERNLLEIPLPVDIDYASSDYDLWVFKGFLSLWVSEYNTPVDIWVMKEYQLHSSWIKILVLTNDFFHYISPICCTKRGDIIGTDGGTGLVKYNDKGEFLEHNSYGASRFRLTMYTESLLSLPSDSEQA